MADPSNRVSLKLFVDINSEKVLFAEAGKDFVDFLFYLLSLPVGTVARLLKKDMVGSLGKLYETIENLSESYLQPNQNKNSLLNPRAPICATEIPLLLSDYELHNRKSYLCSNCRSYVADVPNLLCPRCKQKMTSVLSYVPPSPANTELPVEGGFVKGLVTFMVMDNLEFLPISTRHLFPLLRNFKLEEVGSVVGVQEFDIELGVDEGLKLLKLSLKTEEVLTRFYVGSDQHINDMCKQM